MTTYYRGRDALITDEVFEVRCPYRERFAINQLHDVHIVRSGADPVVLAVARAAAVTSVVILLAGGLFLRSVVAWLAALSLLGVLAVIGVACWRLVPRSSELRATYQNHQVQLFWCRDSRTFGQVARALNRALEGSRDGRISF